MIPTRSCGIISFVIFLIAYAGFLVAFGSDQWVSLTYTRFGLWKKCVRSMCTNMIYQDNTASIITAQVFSCFTLVGGGATIAGYIWWILQRSNKGSILAWTTSVASGFVNAIAIIAWGYNTERYYGYNVLSWAFWLNLACTVLMIANSWVSACATECGTHKKDPISSMYGMPRRVRADSDTSSYLYDQEDIPEVDYSRDRTQNDYVPEKPYRY